MSVGGAISSAMRILGVSAAFSAVGGPILDKELRVTSRRRFTYVLRSVYLALLAGFIALAWFSAFRGSRGTSLFIAAEMAEAGKIITATLAFFQFATLPLVAVLVLAGSISEEIDRRTLGVLLATPITAFQVVSGKLASRLLHLLLLLAAGVPVMIMIRVMGGVPAEFILASTGITFTTILFCGMLTLYLSIGDRRAWRVILKAFAILALIFAFLPILAMYLGYQLTPTPGFENVIDKATLFNPILAILRVTWSHLWPTAGQMPPVNWYAHCGIMLGATAILFLLSVFKVRRVALSQAVGGEGGGRASRRAAKQGTIRRVFGSPVVWKEIRRRTARSRRRTIILQVLALAALVITYAVVGKDLNHQDTQLAYGIILLVVGMLVTAVLAAPAVTAEKEAQTLTLLLVTPLAGAEIIAGKAAGVLWRTLPVWGLLFLHLAVTAVLGVQSGWVFLHVGLLAAGTAAFLVGSGLFFSALVKKSTSAVVLALMLPLFLWGILPAFLAMGSELLSMAREEVELVVCFDPVFLQGIIMMGACHSQDYRWPAAMGHLSMTESTMVILMIAATYAAIGAVLAVLAADRLRARVRRAGKSTHAQ